MHVSGLSLDLNWLLRFVVTAFFVALGLVHLVRNTASKYFVANFEGAEAPSLPSGGPTASNTMPGVERTVDACVVCGNSANKKCSGCKAVRYWYTFNNSSFLVFTFPVFCLYFILRYVVVFVMSILLFEFWSPSICLDG